MVFATLSGLAAFIYASPLLCPSRRINDMISSDGADSWAIVTGSTSGLGLALAKQLGDRGFNVIIHGRDAGKLQALQSELSALYPKRKFKILLLDAKDCFLPDHYEKTRDTILESVKDVQLTLLINNVGIGHSHSEDFRALTETSPSRIDLLLNTNITFMTHLTRFLLPSLSSPIKPPSLIINIGSLAQLAMPYLAVYSATKAFISTFTLALDAELHAEGLDVKVECMVLGDISTPGHKLDLSLAVLSPEQAASCVLDRGGSMGYWGLQPVGCPYWFQAFLSWLCSVQPWFLLRAGFIQNLKPKKNPAKME